MSLIARAIASRSASPAFTRKPYAARCEPPTLTGGRVEEEDMERPEPSGGGRETLIPRTTARISTTVHQIGLGEARWARPQRRWPTPLLPLWTTPTRWTSWASLDLTASRFVETSPSYKTLDHPSRQISILCSLYRCTTSKLSALTNMAVCLP